MPTLFRTDWSAASLTEAINLIPPQYGRLASQMPNGQGGELFAFEGIATRAVAIDFDAYSLRLVPSHAWGGQPSTATKTRRKTVYLEVPQSTMEDVVYPMDVADRRAIGTDGALETVNDLTEKKLAIERMKHEITLEYRRARALDGIILDADGINVIYDLYQVFGVTQTVINFQLNVATTNVLSKCHEVLRAVQTNLLGDVFTGVRCLVSRQFMDALVAHPNVEKYYVAANSPVNLATGGNVRGNFALGPLVFEEFFEEARSINDTPVNFMDPGVGYALPMGTRQLFREYGAPADFNDLMNLQEAARAAAARRFYAKVEPRKFDRGMDLHTQMNVLPIVTQPNAVIKLQAQ